MNQRKERKTLQGEVISNKMAKTAVVKVTRKMRHPRYQKLVESRKKYYAHVETGSCKVGDLVTIVETRPISKLKRWRVVEKTANEEKR
ncbi:MAG: 30S ribosomal protein S17 [Chlamydiota bacterium]